MAKGGKTIKGKQKTSTPYKFGTKSQDGVLGPKNPQNYGKGVKKFMRGGMVKGGRGC